jgi:hypothetical protein
LYYASIGEDYMEILSTLLARSPITLKAASVLFLSGCYISPYHHSVLLICEAVFAIELFAGTTEGLICFVLNTRA